MLRKWLRLLPHPYSVGDRKAGYRYEISILQAEFSLTQVLDWPVTGRVFFEEVIRENLDEGAGPARCSGSLTGASADVHPAEVPHTGDYGWGDPLPACGL